eukprot:PRCOL_00005623-RA
MSSAADREHPLPVRFIMPSEDTPMKRRGGLAQRTPLRLLRALAPSAASPSIGGDAPYI